jgi:hypothetical protein
MAKITSISLSINCLAGGTAGGVNLLIFLNNAIWQKKNRFLGI